MSDNRNDAKQDKTAVYIVDGLRTPYLKARGTPGPFSASDLAVAAARPLLTRQPFSPEELGEVILGCVMPREYEANIGRIVALRLGCGKAMPAWTVARNCGSGLQAIDSACKDIQAGRHDLVLAGGTEAMSYAPIIFKNKMVTWLSNWMKARTLGRKAALLMKFKPSLFTPIISLIHGLTDPIVGLNMGETAEQLAYEFDISREAMDQFAFESHQRIYNAQEAGKLEEITSVFAADGEYYKHDNGVRPHSTLADLAALKPFFDKPYGRVTAGNSSQVTDGASMLILANDRAVKKYNLSILARIVDINWAALSPEVMGLGPVFASTPLLTRNQLTLEDIQYWEINEAFAAQVLACLKAWQSKQFCKKQLGLEEALGKLDQTRLNVDGGAIAIGHPVGSSGARLPLHLAHVLKRHDATYGIATMCIGGGQGGAILLEG